MSSIDADFMRLALNEAYKAYALKEVPVGSVLIYQNKVIAQGYNRVIAKNDPTSHAEIVVIRAASLIFKNYRMPENTTLYCTLEPCAMCLGAIFHARISHLVFASSEPKSGCCGSVCDLSQYSSLNHHTRITKGVLEQESTALLKQFFVEKRKNTH